MRKKEIFIVFYLVFSLVGNAYSQILNDTVQNLYGTKTTFSYTEDDILNLLPGKASVDTLLDDIQNLPFIYGRNTFYQDLGVLGTPTNYYGYLMPDEPGRRYGFNVYDPFTYDPKNIKYYDTYSPFSDIKYVQGSRGQQLFEGRFSRNINNHWNVGFDYLRLSTKKIIGLQRRVPQAVSNAFDFYTRFFAGEKHQYQILANFVYSDMLNQETGGIKPTPGDTLESLFDDLSEDVFLREARSHERRINYRVYQHFSILPNNKLQVYNIFNLSKRANWFKHVLSLNDTSYFDTLGIQSTPKYDTYSSYNAVNDRVYEDQVGFKGKMGKLVYRVYFKYKDIYYTTAYDPVSYKQKEQFAGSYLRYDLADSSHVIGQAEFMLGKDYMLRLKYANNYFSVGYNRLVYHPSLFQTFYKGNYLQWDNSNLNPTATDNFFATIDVRSKHFFAKLDANYYSIKDYIYLDYNAGRKQALPNQTLTVTSLNPEVGMNFFHLHLQNYAAFFFKGGKNGGANLINLPSITNRTRLFFEQTYADAAIFQLGADLNYRSAYYADKYLPFYQHYYLNNDFPVASYWYVDVYLNAQIKQFIGFFKVQNVTDNLFGDRGYFITPYYTGIARTFTFGLIWRFYN